MSLQSGNYTLFCWICLSLHDCLCSKSQCFFTVETGCQIREPLPLYRAGAVCTQWKM